MCIGAVISFNTRHQMYDLKCCRKLQEGHIKKDNHYVTKNTMFYSWCENLILGKYLFKKDTIIIFLKLKHNKSKIFV